MRLTHFSLFSLFQVAIMVRRHIKVKVKELGDLTQDVHVINDMYGKVGS